MRKATGPLSMMENWLITSATLLGLVVCEITVAGAARSETRPNVFNLKEGSLEVKHAAREGQSDLPGLGAIRLRQVRIEIDQKGAYRVVEPGQAPRALDEKGLEAYVKQLPEPGKTEVTMLVPYRPFQLARWMLRSFAVHYEMAEPVARATEKEVDHR